jgi:glycosyltransferase involved in cell wall biosynthesis
VSAPILSILVVARDEAAQLADCLERLRFADDLVVVLDRTSDASAEIARGFGVRVIKGGWPIEGARRNAGIEACTGAWILEVDADERVSEELAAEIRATIADAEPGHFLVPFDNYVSGRLVRHGWGASWGVRAAPRLFSRGAKRWGPQRVHPALELGVLRGRLRSPMAHTMDSGVSAMLARLDRYSTARARDLRDSGDIGTLGRNVRRMFTRFLKCYFGRKGYREGAIGFLIALMAGLYPLISHLKARLEPEAGENV